MTIPEVFRKENGFVIVTHVNPDGDAIGSLLGIYNALKETGKRVWALVEKPVPELYSFLPNSSEILLDCPAPINAVRWIVAVDCADQSRIAGDVSRYSSAKLINIDHHPTNPLYGDITHVKSSATSTAELAHLLLKDAGYRLSKNVGICLYAGLYTDTGGFRFAGVTDKTLRIGSELLAPGIDSYDVTRPLYEEFPLCRIQLESLVLQRVEYYLNNRLLISVIEQTDLDKLGATMADTENLVNRLRESRGVQIGALITKLNNITRVSFRSKDFDVAALAQVLGGGGHVHAAGLKTNLEVDELKSRIVELVAKDLQPLQSGI